MKGRARPTNWYRFVHLMKILLRQRSPIRVVQLSWVITAWLSLKARDSLAKPQTDGALV